MKEDGPARTPGASRLEELLAEARQCAKAADAYNREAEEYQPAITNLVWAVEALVKVLEREAPAERSDAEQKDPA
jgi:hypothetical protein